MSRRKRINGFARRSTAGDPAATGLSPSTPRFFGGLAFFPAGGLVSLLLLAFHFLLALLVCLMTHVIDLTHASRNRYLHCKNFARLKTLN